MNSNLKLGLTISIASFLFTCLSACSSTDKAPGATATPAPIAAVIASKPLPKTVAEAVNSEFRVPEHRQRDQFRHPQQTLEFFGIKPDMTVVEIWPAGGWYTEILAPYLATQGHYVAAANHPANAEVDANAKKLAAWVKQNPQASSGISYSEFNPPEEIDIAPEGSADMVLTFRNVHNWMRNHNEQRAFVIFFTALKHGGILGVVEHRAPANSKFDKEAESGYVREKDVIQWAQKAGFKLAAKSEINANPKDNHKHPKGVWSLPPSYAGGDDDHDKFEAIGESDRMTLKFVKP